MRKRKLDVSLTQQLGADIRGVAGTRSVAKTTNHPEVAHHLENLVLGQKRALSQVAD